MKNKYLLIFLVISLTINIVLITQLFSEPANKEIEDTINFDNLYKDQQQEIENLKESARLLLNKQQLLQTTNLELKENIIHTELLLEKEKNKFKKSSEAQEITKKPTPETELPDTLEKFAQKMMSDKNFDPVKQANNQFSNQGVDFLWASSYENNVVRLFSSEAFSALTLDSVSCKESICKLSIYAQDVDPFHAASILSQSLSEQGWQEPDASFIFNHEPIDGVLNFYLGRNKDSFNY